MVVTLQPCSKPAATENGSKLDVPDRNNCSCVYVHVVIVN